MQEKGTVLRDQQRQTGNLQQMRKATDILHVVPSRPDRHTARSTHRRANSSATCTQSPTVSPRPRISPGAASRRPSSPSSTCHIIKDKYESHESSQEALSSY